MHEQGGPCPEGKLLLVLTNCSSGQQQWWWQLTSCHLESGLLFVDHKLAASDNNTEDSTATQLGADLQGMTRMALCHVQGVISCL